MNITFEEKTYPFDDIEYSWYIRSSVNDYRVTMNICGAIDEDGTENPYGGIMGTISIYEVSHNLVDVFDKMQTALTDAGLEPERNADTIMVNAPDIREYMDIRNESSFDDTLQDLNTVISVISTTLFNEENGNVLFGKE